MKNQEKSTTPNVYNAENNQLSNIENIELTNYKVKDIEELSDGEKKTNEEDKKKKRKSLIPTNDIELLLLARRVIEKMDKYAEVVISWMSKEEFIKLTDKFDLAIKTKYRQKDSRSPVVNELTLLDEEINDKTANLKALLLLHYGKDSVRSHYSAYGLVKMNKGYFLPRDRSERLMSLEKLAKQLEENNIDHPDYGIAYWKRIYERYKELFKQNLNYSEDISYEAGKLSEYRKDIRKYLSSYVQMVKIQYNEDEEKLKSYLRDLGFMPEHY